MICGPSSVSVCRADRLEAMTGTSDVSATRSRGALADPAVTATSATPVTPCTSSAARLSLRIGVSRITSMRTRTGRGFPGASRMSTTRPTGRPAKRTSDAGPRPDTSGK